MTPRRPALTRRLADTLMTHAANAMPSASSRWALAMRNELAHVPGDREALHWAIGCVVVAHRTRLRQFSDATMAVRAAGAALALFCAFDATIPTLIAALHSTDVLGRVGFLAALVPGDDLGRLVPLANALPHWLHVLTLGCGACYVAAAGSLFARSGAARVLLIVGVGLGLASTLLARAILAPIGRVTPDPSLLSTVVVPVALPLLAAIVARPIHGRS